MISILYYYFQMIRNLSKRDVFTVFIILFMPFFNYLKMQIFNNNQFSLINELIVYLAPILLLLPFLSKLNKDLLLSPQINFLSLNKRSLIIFYMEIVMYASFVLCSLFISIESKLIFSTHIFGAWQLSIYLLIVLYYFIHHLCVIVNVKQSEIFSWITRILSFMFLLGICYLSFKFQLTIVSVDLILSLLIILFSSLIFFSLNQNNKSPQ